MPALRFFLGPLSQLFVSLGLRAVSKTDLKKLVQVSQTKLRSKSHASSQCRELGTSSQTPCHAMLVAPMIVLVFAVVVDEFTSIYVCSGSWIMTNIIITAASKNHEHHEHHRCHHLGTSFATATGTSAVKRVRTVTIPSSIVSISTSISDSIS